VSELVPETEIQVGGEQRSDERHKSAVK